MKLPAAPEGFPKWEHNYIESTKSHRGRRMRPEQVQALYVLGHDVQLGISGHFYTYGIENNPSTGFVSRNSINSLIKKGLAKKSGERRALPELTDAGREMFNAVSSYDATRPFDLPSDAPDSTGKGLARTFTDMHDDHKFRFLTALTMVLRRFPDAKPSSTLAGVYMIPAKDYDFDTGKEIASYCYDVRVYFATVNYRVFKSSYLPAAALASDVCRIAFHALRSTRRKTPLPSDTGFNFPIEIVRAALEDERVQVCLWAILKWIDPNFPVLVLQYPPPPAPVAPTYSELTAKLDEALTEVARLTALLTAANVVP